MMACVGLVLQAQRLPGWKDCNDEEKLRKVNFMWMHKSFGVLSLLTMMPRVYFRMTRRLPAHAGQEQWETVLSQLSHYGLYALVVAMPVTGVTMGLASGNGLPFFITTIPPLSGEFGKATSGWLAGKAYQLHSWGGQALEYMIALHVGAVGYHHLVKKHNIVTRVNPFI